MGFAAINAVAHGGEESRARESLEAQESRIANNYATGLRFVEEGRRSDAVVSPHYLFQHMLADHEYVNAVAMPVKTGQSHLLPISRVAKNTLYCVGAAIFHVCHMGCCHQ